MIQNKQKIELNKEQFKILLKLVYVGNWLANANRDGSPENPHKEEYEKLEDYIFSLAKQFGFDEWVDDEGATEGKFFPTRLFEEETDVRELIEEYDEETFWDELTERLAEIKFAERYPKKEYKKMSREEYFNKFYRIHDEIAELIEERGLEAIEIKK